MNFGYKIKNEFHLQPAPEQINYPTVSDSILVDKVANELRFSMQQLRSLQTLPEPALVGVEQLSGFKGQIQLNLAAEENSETELKIGIAEIEV